jgi:light-regulated signal transduction histidine kinase (bacteriophytochrome)
LTLRRALVNLVENAIKYTQAGGTVELSLERDGEHAVVAVTDTGVGMNPADAERIFEPFVRLDAARTGEAGARGSACRSFTRSSSRTTDSSRCKRRPESAARSPCGCRSADGRGVTAMSIAASPPP